MKSNPCPATTALLGSGIAAWLKVAEETRWSLSDALPRTTRTRFHPIVSPPESTLQCPGAFAPKAASPPQSGLTEPFLDTSSDDRPAKCASLRTGKGRSQRRLPILQLSSAAGRGMVNQRNPNGSQPYPKPPCPVWPIYLSADTGGDNDERCACEAGGTAGQFDCATP